MKDFSLKTCKNCGSTKFKRWKDLTEDEKLLIQKLPANVDYSAEQRKKHRFCGRCFYEVSEESQIA